MRYNHTATLFLSCLLLLLVAVGCVRPASRSKQPEVDRLQQKTKDESIQRHELSSDNDNRKEGKPWSIIAEEAEKSNAYDRLNKSNEAIEPTMEVGMFSGAESEHVRISTYDPFQGKSYLFYDLAEMGANFHYPCDGPLISDYGTRNRRMHTGVDIKAGYGANIYAAFDGVVRMSKNYSGYGNVIVIRHNNGLETVYSHNSKNKVKVNQQVKAGEVIALAGRTGTASTEHLHFEVRVQGQYFNPNLLIDVINRKIQDKGLYVYRRGSSITASYKQPQEQQMIAEKESPQPIIKSAIAPTQGSSSQAIASGDAIYHKIVSGDTLSHLAGRYKTTVNTICQLNGISKTKILRLGEKIRVK